MLMRPDGTINELRALGFLLGIFLVALPAGGCGGGTEAAPEQTRRGDPQTGKHVFLKAGCGTCHTFKAAGSTKTIGPNLDLVVEVYDPPFIRRSIVDPEAYFEKLGNEPGSIGGDRPYHATMPSFGAKADTPGQQLTDQELADLVAFLTQRKEGG